MASRSRPWGVNPPTHSPRVVSRLGFEAGSLIVSRGVSFVTLVSASIIIDNSQLTTSRKARDSTLGCRTRGFHLIMLLKAEGTTILAYRGLHHVALISSEMKIFDRGETSVKLSAEWKIIEY